MLVAGEPVVGTEGEVRAVDPATGAALEPAFGAGGAAEVERAARAAEEAFDTYRATSPQERAAFLERIADAVEGLGDELVERARAESGLPEARLRTERGRTTGQLRLFAEVLREGSSTGVRIDPARPDREPAPRPDVRQRRVPVGPVAVFGSSNFPLAFSNAGGDTASALAAGCPVVVKAHNAHPGTGMLVAGAVAEAVAASGLPGGVYSSLIGAGTEIGAALVGHPLIAAVGFTGSRAGGLALLAVAQARPQPIPVYAEMSSINPVYLFPDRLTDDVATGFVGSLTLGAGQFCTNPGLVFVPRGGAGDRFVATVGAQVGAAAGQTMLTAGIGRAFVDAAARVAAVAGVREVGRGSAGPTGNAPAPAVFEVDVRDFLARPELQAEMFGAAALIVRHDGVDDLLAATRALEGQLTATVHAAPAEYADVARLLPALERRAGRIVFGGWPTGVEVNHAMVHGGPFPATSDGRTTSVGTLAIERFLRPVAYQDLPAELLPEPVHPDNPWRQLRRVDGRIEGLA
ncbi:aldehyde dehydrogenase (NADP(+)) [Pseudonocardia sp. S2-4]|uniref:Aldehyde dehydrogenase (NADP(+)) n=2 Tax=Pseudonocardia humida TaxID=2800819 RepID=A0ABT0ZST2_9PSEU|nr:aldehyde dehydrogenase (NADP(+)) [Pseudonocardia humida]